MATSPQTQELGMTAPDFALTEVIDGGTVTLEDQAGAPALLVAFLSKHCPYVQHVQHEFGTLSADYQDRGVAVVGIGANDPAVSPEDSPEGLAEQKRDAAFTFPYLFDADQSVAKAFGAVCTPDFFLFDADRKLVYRGQMDASRPNQGEPDGADLRAALDAVLEGTPVPEDQAPPVGCSIKWSPGNEPS